ncbi:uncharacterized protein LOC116613944 [Nematostella vectensis]|uniref:uncharacterized protein LOC116613944 n=1 Tax=Nematostella vectensis TaxID=45351 RepID=UPI0013902DB6|nr:uncharacterized protein LOC116613944 [Nematostella vectensis]
MASILKFGVKCGIAGGLVYGISSLGLFSSQDRTISSFKRLTSKTKEYVPEEYVSYIPKVPSSLDVQQTWNSGVKKVFISLDSAPDKAVDLAKSAAVKSKDFVQKQLKS